MAIDSNKRAYLIGPDFVRELNRWRRSVLSDVEKQIDRLKRDIPSIREKDVRAAITVGYDPDANGGEGEENVIHYPASSANTFWVKLAKPGFTKTAGDQTLTMTAYDPAVYRIVHQIEGDLPDVGSNVWIHLLHGQYFQLPGSGGGGARLVRFEMQEGWSMSNVAAASIYEMDGSLGPGASVRDPEGIFGGLALGDTGLAIHQDGENWAIQANCPSEEY